MIDSLLDAAAAALVWLQLFLLDSWPVLAILAVAWFRPPMPRLVDRIGASLEAIARRRWLAAAIVVLLSLSVSAAIVAYRGMPLPTMHDDRACYLGGQMFANGRASYPTHPLWPHFETFHVLQKPSYASKYPIGNELLLAAGLRLTGVALAGPWIAGGAACAAIFWALCGALPPRWAFIGGLVAAIHPLMIFWSRSYRGGGLAVIGGALLVGAVVRMTQAPSARVGAIAGAGLSMLAMSRPYEGFVLAVGCAIALLVHTRPSRALAIAAAACAVVTTVGLVPIALHNRAVTGSFVNLPWAEYARQYDPVPQFIWQKPGSPPHYRNQEMAFVYHRMYRRKFERVTAPGGLVDDIRKKISYMEWMIVRDPDRHKEPKMLILFAVPLLALPRALREDKFVRMSAILVAVFLFAPFSIFVNLMSHYLAPVTAAVAMLLLLLIRRISGDPRGKWIVAALALVFLAYASESLKWKRGPAGQVPLRLAVEAGPGKHLFIVAPDVFGLIYNEPDIEAARIVWARDLGDNPKLREHFRNRAQWQVERVDGRVRLRRLPPP